MQRRSGGRPVPAGPRAAEERAAPLPLPPVVALGASTGGVGALMAVAAALPADLAAAVLVVLHVSADGPDALPDILGRAGALPVATAVDGAPLRAGHIATAPPDRHLEVRHGRVRLSSGPRVGGARPSIDALFDSLVPLGDRSVAVVLSGTLGDGSAGLRRLGIGGGSTVVQDPADADFPGLPRRAVDEARPDHVLPLARIAPAIVDLVDGLAAPGPVMLAPEVDADAP